MHVTMMLSCIIQILMNIHIIHSIYPIQKNIYAKDTQKMTMTGEALIPIKLLVQEAKNPWLKWKKIIVSL